MPGGCEGDLNALETMLVPPIKLRNERTVNPPAHQMPFNALRYKVLFGFCLEFLNAGIV